MKGYIILENGDYKFKTDTNILKNEIGYVKYGNKIESSVDLGFIDYYPITQFLLEKLYVEKTICLIETQEEQITLHDNKLIIII